MRIKVKISEAMLEFKKKQIKQLCAYGFTHFCDGKVNKSVAKEGTNALPPCPHKHECELRKFSIITEIKDEKGR